MSIVFMTQNYLFNLACRFTFTFSLSNFFLAPGTDPIPVATSSEGIEIRIKSFDVKYI